MTMTHRPTVLVLGAAGRFGAAAVAAFAGAGWRVLAQQRRAPACALPAGAEYVDTPLHDTAALAARAAGASVVVYAVNPPYHRWEAELMPLFEQGLAVAQALGARCMLPGSVYNYGAAHMPPVLREDTPQRPGTRKGEQRIAMEARLQELAAQGLLDSVLIRAGDFFGAGSGSWLDQAVVKDIARGRLVYPGPLDRMHAWTYLPDLAQAFVAVAAAPRVRGLQRWHHAGHACTGRDFLAALEEAAASLGLQPAGGWRHGGMPWGLVRVVGLVHPVWRELARMRYLWQVPHALDGSALARAVGPLPATPLVAALRQSLLDLGLAVHPLPAPRVQPQVAAS
jgi:nucleoside-diphosphate-sugar epimerase